LLREKRENN